MTQELNTAEIEEFCGRIFGGLLQTMEVTTVFLGDALGLYTALAETGPITSSKLAEHTGLDERYLREWLDQQAVAGIIAAENGGSAPRRYSISPEHAIVLTEKTSPAYLGGVGKLLNALGSVLPALVEAFKTGQGVPYSAYGPDAVDGQAELTLPGYVNSLVAEWVPQVRGLKERLEVDPPARVAEIACGVGNAAVELAKGFPKIKIDGYDLDETSIARARKNAEEAGVSDRVSFHVHDARDPKLAGTYDVVAVFEAIHDMGNPVPALETLKRLLVPGGIGLVADERVADTFTAPGDDLERFMAAASVTWCLPQGRADGNEAHGTMMRAPEFKAYAARAGWKSVEELPIEHPSWRFYQLAP